MKTLVVVGQGYVGLPMALEAAKVGMTVWGLDTNQNLVDQLNSGVSHIGDVSDADLAYGVASGYRATTDSTVISTADYIVVCVPTPLDEAGGPDLRPVESSAKVIGTHVARGALVVLESTTYPGTTEEIFAPLVTKQGRLTIGEDIFIAFSPERIDPGRQDYGVKNTPKVVGGLTAECTSRAKEFYGQFIDTVVTAKGAKEAEMAKLLENTFRHVNIALVNEMVRFSQELDIDLWDAINAAESKPFGFMAFRPGPGVGGHCIPVDPSYLSHRVKAKLGYAFRMVELAEEINHAAPEYVASRAWRNLNDAELSVKGAKILLVGVTYKPNIADQRESPADPLAHRLLSYGAEVRYLDPYVPEWVPEGLSETLHSVTDVAQSCRDADLVILLQPHREIDFDMVIANSRSVLDTQAFLPPGDNIDRL
ncbi:nucleotide sugar dehydrogenase [Citricoccus zhacaiensis]